MCKNGESREQPLAIHVIYAAAAILRRAEECTISDKDVMRGFSKESKKELYLTRKLRVILVLTLE